MIYQQRDDEDKNLFYVLSSNIILFLLSGPQIPIYPS